MALHILAFSMGPGPIAFFITSEMVGQNARSAAQSWTTIVQMGCRAIISAIYLPFWELLGAFAYLILFVGPLAVAAIILYFYLPETKNRNVEEVRQVISDLPKLETISSKVSTASFGRLFTSADREFRFDILCTVFLFGLSRLWNFHTLSKFTERSLCNGASEIWNNLHTMYVLGTRIYLCLAFGSIVSIKPLEFTIEEAWSCRDQTELYRRWLWTTTKQRWMGFLLIWTYQESEGSVDH